MILELKGIFKNYQQGKMSVPVLKDVNFSMEEGEYVAIMGPSGSGKTTLMNIIGCLDKPTEGKFFLDGQDILNCSENDMSDIRLNKIGFVFQSFHLLPRQSALAVYYLFFYFFLEFLNIQFTFSDVQFQAVNLSLLNLDRLIT